MKEVDVFLSLLVWVMQEPKLLYPCPGMYQTPTNLVFKTIRFQLQPEMISPEFSVTITVISDVIFSTPQKSRICQIQRDHGPGLCWISFGVSDGSWTTRLSIIRWSLPAICLTKYTSKHAWRNQIEIQDKSLFIKFQNNNLDVWEGITKTFSDKFV